MTNTFFLLCMILSLLISVPGRGQTSEVARLDCPYLLPLTTLDSTIIRADTDYGYKQIAGRWKWVQIQSGWGQPRKPARSVWMINQQGQGELYENDTLLSNYQLKIIRGYDAYSFTIREDDKPFFDLRRAHLRGWLIVCTKFLVLGEGLGDGRQWVFERLVENGKTQSVPSNNADRTADCPPLPPAPRKEQIINGVQVVSYDSVAIQASVDLAYKQAKGNWQLVDIRGGWVAHQSPQHAYKLVLDERGQGLIYKDGQPSTTIQLALDRVEQSFYFPIRQQGNRFFHPCKSGSFSICDKTLILSERMGDGDTFVFKRIE